MSKKRAKSGAGSAGPQKWEQAILSAPFCEEGKWNAAVVWIIENQLEDEVHINELAAAVNGGARKLFSHVTKNDLFELINDLGNPKNKGKVKEVPANSEICEPCRNYIEIGEDIPLPLLAKLIKFKLLDVKSKDVRRRDAEKKPATAGGDKGGKAAGKGGKAEKPKSAGKGAKGGGKKTPEVPSPKGDTKLRRRGEEDTDSKYIDDEPDDGPEFYIFVSGFYQPHLVPLLSDIGINVDAIIKVLSDKYEVLQPPPDPSADPAETPTEEKLQAEEEERKKVLKTKKELKTFWRDALTLLQKAPEGSRMHDLARLEYIVKTDIMPKNVEDPEEKLEFGLALFEDTACLVYDLLDARRQWQNFLNNLNLLNVPVMGTDPAANALQDAQSQHSATPGPGATTTLPVGALPGDEAPAPAKPETDMRYYKELMDTIPQESTSVPLMMHSMLEQIVAWEEEKEPPSEIPRPPWADGVEDGLSNHITSSAFKLALSEEEQQNLASELKVPKAVQLGLKQPMLIDHNDKLTWRLHHLKAMHGFDPLKVEAEMSEFSPLADIIRLRQPSARGSRERAARLQELLHFCSNAALTRAEIDHAFKQFVFETMNLTAVEENGSVTKSEGCTMANPWDDPFPLFTNQADDVELFEPPPPPPAAHQTGPVEADKLAKELEAIQFKPDAHTPSPPPRPASGASGRSSRSRNKKKRAKSPKSKEAPVPASPPPSAENNSRPNSGGILKSPSRSGSRSGVGSRRSSVHFEQNEEGLQVPHPGDNQGREDTAIETPRTVDDTMSKVVKLQKLNLDQWCFAEHFEPGVLKEVLAEALYNLPYIDTYYHRKDHSLLLALHNPCNAALHSTVSWQTNLHSNVGFRNYLEHVAAAIEEWTRIEEAKYEATLLAKEVEHIQKDAEASASRPASGAAKKGRDRSKSPKKATSRTGRSSSRGSSGERSSSTNMFIREGSLKAQKLEMDAQKAELDEVEKSKNEKRARSAGKKSGKEDEKKDKKAGSRSSSKSRMSKEVLDTDAPDGEPKEKEKQWPFMGYDVGNNMIHVGGTVTTMFPADGGVIQVEKTEFVQGTISVNTTVRKDGHQFMVHVIDPHIEAEEDTDECEEKECVEKAEEEKNEKDAPVPKPVGRFGSMVACLKDGMNLSFSNFGPSGEPDQARKELATPSILPTPRTPSPSKAPDSPSKSRKDKGKTATPEPTIALEDEELKEEVIEEEPVIQQNFQQMFITCPDGLNLSFQLESALGANPASESDRRLTVKQTYPFKTCGDQECEALRKKAMEETSRVITSEGVVICFMEEGPTKLLYPDGKVSYLQGLPPAPSSRASSPQRVGSAKSGAETPTKKVRGKKSAINPEVVADSSEEEPKKLQWTTVMSDGKQIAHYVDGTKIDTKDALICSATDPQTQQVLLTREDHVMTVSHPDGTTIVEHADGTRITQYTRELEVQVSEGNNETGEAPEIQLTEVIFVHVECPGYATVKFNTLSTECSVEFGTGTVINANPSGTYDLYHHDGGYLQVESDGTTVYNPRSNNDLEIHNPDLDMRYLVRHFSETIVESIDNEGNQFSVKHTGDTNVNLSGVATVMTEEKEVGEEKDNIKHVVHYKQHAPRFFVINGDGSGSEMLRYQDVAEFISNAEDDPSTAILMDQIQDCPGVNGITVLKPFTRGISERWLRTYSQETMIPPGLTSRDLKTLPPIEYKQEGTPAFGTNVGQGLMVGSVVKAGPKPPVLKCPSVLEVRRLIQYKPVNEELRESMKKGLRDYAKFVQTRQDDTDNIMVCDPRNEEEKMNAANIAAVAKSYADSNTIKTMYEKATATPIAEPAPTPQPKRSRADWERDMREVEIEKENKRALHMQDVPNYFHSELGKEFLLSHAPDIDYLTKQLAAGTLRGSPHGTSDATTTPENRIADPSVNPSQQSHISDRTEASTTPEGCNANPNVASPYIREYGYTPSSVRPGNPTPAHALGQGSPAPLRPKNPTPGHATSMSNVVDRPGAPTPKEAARNMTSETPSSSHPVYPSIPEQPLEEPVTTAQYYEETEPVMDPMGDMEPMGHRNLLVDVVGAPRRQPVAIPAYISKNGRPNSISNEKYNQVEDPVRRHVYTSSVAGATSKGAHTLARMRGFELLPNFVDFGVLKEGNTYAFPVHLKNTGVDSCRFKLTQPPPSTGLRVLFRPGPVAAGMKTEITLELYAIAVGATGEVGVGKMVHNVEIITETDRIHLPVVATVLTAYEFDNRGRNTPRGDKNPGVKWVSNRPPATQGLIRPRRTNKEALVN